MLCTRLTDEAIGDSVGLRLGMILRSTRLYTWHNIYLTGYHVKEAHIVSSAITRSTRTYEELLNMQVFRPQKNQRACSEAMKNVRMARPWFSVKVIAAWHGSSSCGHPGKILHANHISDTMRSGRSSSSTAEKSKVRRHHPVARFRSFCNRDSGTNQFRWSTFIRPLRRTPFISFRWSKWNLNLVPDNICTDLNFQSGCFPWFFPCRYSVWGIIPGPVFYFVNNPLDFNCRDYWKISILFLNVLPKWREDWQFKKDVYLPLQLCENLSCVNL